MSICEEYREIRQLWIDNILAEAKEEIDNVTDNFPLARARERWRIATWYAERRDSERYGGQRLNINIIGLVTMSEALVEEAGTLLDHIAKQ